MRAEARERHAFFQQVHDLTYGLIVPCAPKVYSIPLETIDAAGGRDI